MTDKRENQDFPGSSATRLGDTPDNVVEPAGRPESTDHSLKLDVESAIAKTGLAHGVIDVRVKGGIVTLIGVVDRGATKTAVTNSAGAVAGVKEIDDQIEVHRDKGRPEGSARP
jgi:osmotically-inducible protein OsmY